MKSGQKGFTVIETLLVLILLAILGFTGYYVWHSQKQTDKTLNTAANERLAAPIQKSSSSKSSNSNLKTYNGNGFTLKYPSDWMFVAKGTKAGGGEYASDEFLPSKNYPANNAYTLFFDSTSSSQSPHEYGANNSMRGELSAVDSTVNGYPAYTINYSVPGPGGLPNGYRVIVGNNDKLVIFNYVSSGNYTDSYKAIVSSIKFNN